MFINIKSVNDIPDTKLDYLRLITILNKDDMKPYDHISPPNRAKLPMTLH